MSNTQTGTELAVVFDPRDAYTNGADAVRDYLGGFLCLHCGSRLRNIDQLESHVQFAHRDEKAKP